MKIRFNTLRVIKCTKIWLSVLWNHIIVWTETFLNLSSYSFWHTTKEECHHDIIQTILFIAHIYLLMDFFVLQLQWKCQILSMNYVAFFCSYDLLHWFCQREKSTKEHLWYTELDLYLDKNFFLCRNILFDCNKMSLYAIATS